MPTLSQDGGRLTGLCDNPETAQREPDGMISCRITCLGRPEMAQAHATPRSESGCADRRQETARYILSLGLLPNPLPFAPKLIKARPDCYEVVSRAGVATWLSSLSVQR